MNDIQWHPASDERYQFHILIRNPSRDCLNFLHADFSQNMENSGTMHGNTL